MELHGLRLLLVLGNKHLVIVFDPLHKVSQTHCVLADHRVACKAPLTLEVAITKRVSIVRFLAPDTKKVEVQVTAPLGINSYIGITLHAKQTSLPHAHTHTHTHACTRTCMHTPMHTHMHAHTHARAHTHTHTCMHTHMRAHTHTHTHTCMHTHMRAHTHTHTPN